MDDNDQSSQPQTESDDQPPPSIHVEIIDGLGLLTRTAQDSLALHAQSALNGLSRGGQVRVSIVDDQRMIEAHTKFSRLATTTDVLTFDLAPESQSHEESHTDKVLDTDLTVCFDQASREASERNHPIEHELLLYIVHGVLHCLGYDDHDEDGYQRMHEKEDELLTRIGIGATFFSQEKKP
jgi:probable rRNA maturation factor